MEYTSLGRSGLKVSRLCLGTMNFGVSTDEKESFRIMDAALDAGINFFDTADIYGWGENSGTTENIIGRWFAQGGNRREKTVLATKFHEDICDKNDGPNTVQGLSAYKLRRHLDGSLKRLQTDYVEVYYMHHIDRTVTWEEIWGAYEIQINAGKIGYAASSNFAGWDIAVAQAAANSRHFLGIIAEQHKYNLNCRLPELEVLPSAMHHGVGIIPWGPLDGGFLSSNALKNPVGGRTKDLKDLDEKRKNQLLDYEKFCRELGYSQNAVSIAWLLSNPAVDSPVIGPRTAGQLDDLLLALEVKLDEGALDRLDKIFPGPGGVTPNAYAW